MKINELIATNYREYKNKKNEIFHSITEKRMKRALIIKKNAQKEKLGRIKAVLKKKENRIQIRRNIVSYILEEGLKRYRYRTWIILIYFFKIGEEAFDKIEVF